MTVGQGHRTGGNRCRGTPWRRSDRGSATVWSLGLMAVLVVAFAGIALLGQAVVARHRAGSAADLAALAAADRALDGEGPACALAARVATAQGALLRRCAVTGEISDVTAEVGGAQVRSRAGPAVAEAVTEPQQGASAAFGPHPAERHVPPERGARAVRGAIRRTVRRPAVGRGADRSRPVPAAWAVPR